MSLFDNLILGFSIALTFKSLTYCLAGVTLGTLVGVLPGLGTLAAIAMLLPLTFQLDPLSAVFCLTITSIALAVYVYTLGGGQ